MYGRNMAYAQEGARRKYLAANAQAREQLGLPASYGAPVMMPPTNRLGGALQLLSTGLSIASNFTTAFPGAFAPKPDVASLGTNFTSRIDPTFGHIIRTFD